MIDNIGAQIAIQKRAQNRSIEVLLGIVTGIVADQELKDIEIQFLKNWLLDHPEAASVWPGSVIASTVGAIMADGVITIDERGHLLSVLQELAVTDFASTGSTAAEVLRLPINDEVHVDLRERHICLTGEFVFGTRNKCEQLTTKAGGIPVDNVSRKVAYLVIGTNVSPAWAHTSYGRKIEAAIQLKNSGRSIEIISEPRWIAAIESL